MKTSRSLLVLVIGLFALSPAFGQFITKGSIIGSGSLEFSTGKYETDSGFGTSESDESSFGLGVWGGYFIINNLGLGLSLDYGSAKTEFDSDNFDKDSYFTFGPVVRYYFVKGFYGQGSYAFGKLNSESASGGSKFDSSSKLVSSYLAAGYSVRLSDRVLLDPMIGFRSMVEKEDDTDYIYTSSGIFIRAGITVLFVAK